MLTASEEGTIHYWKLGAEKPIVTLHSKQDIVSAVALSSDGQQALAGSISGAIRFYDDVQSNKEPTEIGFASGTILALAFSPKDHRAISTSSDGSVVLWDLLHKKRVTDLFGHSAEVSSASFSPDGKYVLTGSGDGTTKMWDATTGSELLQLVNFNDGQWMVSTPKGLFDASNLLDLSGVRWIFPDEIHNPLPPEAFLNDYFEPRLLARLFAGETFNAKAQLSSLNRNPPKVWLEKAEWEDEPNGLAKVTVKIANPSSTAKDGESGRKAGVYDLHILRDGQVVDARPEKRVEWLLAPTPFGTDDDKELWKQKTRLDLDSDGTKEFAFNVQVAHPIKDPEVSDEEKGKSRWTRWMWIEEKTPQTAKDDIPPSFPVGTVEFGAYAFNEDRIKSSTSFQTLEITDRLRSRQAKAYLISVGVNKTQSSPSWDLEYAVNDARAMSDLLYAALKPQYLEVVPIRLISDSNGKLGKGETLATTDHLKTVLDLLAGRPVSASSKKQIPNATKIVKAQPEDLVLLTISSHGYTDPRGVFHMVLYDIGKDTPTGRITEPLQNLSLSSNQLSAWLAGVDVINLIMVVDACHSASTVLVDGFKPGPMGSHGLGQLAYDKGMRILAASQADDVALEIENLHHGLLTYALVVDALKPGEGGKLAADLNADGQVTLGEWLKYGEQRTPSLYTDVKAGKIKIVSLSSTIKPRDSTVNPAFLDEAIKKAQTPALFDFHRQNSEIVLRK